MNLKNTIVRMNAEFQKKLDEIEGLKRNIQSSKWTEIEMEVKIYMDEC